MRKVLIIGYYFPPIGGSGTQRPLKFVKFLPELGWRPYVVTTDQAYGCGAEGRDETLLGDVPAHVQVWRVPTPEPRPVSRLARWVGWRSAGAQEGPQKTTAMGPGKEVPLRTSLRRRMRRTILSPLYLIQNPPVDPALYWSLRIVPLARRIIQNQQIDVILTTVPPWSALMAGRLLQRLTLRPWVADFRDPWTDNTFIYFPSSIQHRLNLRLERHLINSADALISVTEPCVAGLRRKTSVGRRNKPFVLIPNGWDRDDFRNLAAVQAGLAPPKSIDGRVVLLHPGSAYQGEPLPLLMALERLDADGFDVDRLRFHFVGYMHSDDRTRISKSAHQALFRFDADRVTHDEALQLMHRAHVLLLLRGGGPDASSGKIYEYMVVGRPVLAIAAADGAAGKLVQRCGIGWTVNPDDVAGLANALRQIGTDYGRFVGRHYRPNWAVIERFERRRLAHRLSELFDCVLGGGCTDF